MLILEEGMTILRKYIEKYNSTPVQVRASFWFLVCGVFQNGLNIFTLPIFTRLLTTEQYGLSSTYFAWNDLIEVICTLRLSYGAFDKGMMEYIHCRDKFESALLGLTTTISVSMLGIFLLFHSQIEKIMGMNFVLCASLFLIQICTPAFLFWTARNKYEYSYRKLMSVTLITAVCVTFLNLLAVLYIDYDKGIVKIISYQIVWALIFLMIYVRIFWKGKTYYNKEIWRYALKFNLPLIPYFLSTLILDKADRIMIGWFCGQSSAALYSVSYNLGRLMVLLTSSLGATFTPWIYQKLKNYQDNQDTDIGNIHNITAMLMVGFLGVATLFMLFSPEFIMIFVDKAYADAVYVIPPVVAGYFFVMIYNLVSNIEFYYERTKIIAAITVITSGLNVFLNYLLIPKFGYVAAAYTTLICYMVMAGFHMLYSRKIAGVELQNSSIFPWKIFILLSTAMLAITGGVIAIYPYVLVRYSLIIGICLLTFLCRKKILEVIGLLKKR